MAFIESFTKIKNKVVGADLSGIDGKLAIQVNLTGKNEGIFYFEVKDGDLAVEPYDYHDNDAIITVDPADLIKIIDGKLDPIKAFNAGKLEVQGNIEKVMALNNILIQKK